MTAIDTDVIGTAFGADADNAVDNKKLIDINKYSLSPYRDGGL